LSPGRCGQQPLSDKAATLRPFIHRTAPAGRTFFLMKAWGDKQDMAAHSIAWSPTFGPGLPF